MRTDLIHGRFSSSRFVFLALALTEMTISSCGNPLAPVKSPATVMASASPVIGQSSSPSNRPPIVSSFLSQSVWVATGASTSLTVAASDPDGDALVYSFSILGGGGTLSGTNAATGKTYTSTGLANGTNAFLRVLVSDGKGGTATNILKINLY